MLVYILHFSFKYNKQRSSSVPKQAQSMNWPQGLSYKGNWLFNSHNLTIIICIIGITDILKLDQLESSQRYVTCLLSQKYK